VRNGGGREEWANGGGGEKRGRLRPVEIGGQPETLLCPILQRSDCGGVSGELTQARKTGVGGVVGLMCESRCWVGRRYPMDRDPLCRVRMRAVDQKTSGSPEALQSGGQPDCQTQDYFSTRAEGCQLLRSGFFSFCAHCSTCLNSFRTSALDA